VRSDAKIFEKNSSGSMIKSVFSTRVKNEDSLSLRWSASIGDNDRFDKNDVEWAEEVVCAKLVRYRFHRGTNH